MYFPDQKTILYDAVGKKMWNIFQYVGGCWGVLRRFGGNTSVTVKSNWQVISIILEPPGLTGDLQSVDTNPSTTLILKRGQIRPSDFWTFDPLISNFFFDFLPSWEWLQYPGKHDHHTDWFLHTVVQYYTTAVRTKGLQAQTNAIYFMLLQVCFIPDRI